MTWLLIDGNNWYARDFFASHGKVGGMFSRRLRNLMDQIDHSRVAVCWDAFRSFRNDLNSDYKADRAEKPAGFKPKLEETRNEVAAVAGVHSFHVDGFEADDLIASLARQAQDEGEKAIMFSADEDLHQCLIKGCVTQVLSVRRATMDRLSFDSLNSDKLETKFGVSSWQWVDYQVMVGGQDGLKGCEGIGVKTAAQVLKACGSLDQFYNNPFKAPISDKQRNKLLEFRPRVELLRDMVTLVDSVPLPATWLQGVAI